PCTATSTSARARARCLAATRRTSPAWTTRTRTSRRCPAMRPWAWTYGPTWRWASSCTTSPSGGDVIQTGGGGGVNCKPQGVFKLFQSPVYSTYEVGTVGGDVRISSVHSCWMGVVELHVGNTVVMHANQLADPDAIEILANNIAGNLICRGNSRTWDN